jgi:hypothetical protein
MTNKQDKNPAREHAVRCRRRVDEILAKARQGPYTFPREILDDLHQAGVVSVYNGETECVLARSPQDLAWHGFVRLDPRCVNRDVVDRLRTHGGVPRMTLFPFFESAGDWVTFSCNQEGDITPTDLISRGPDGIPRRWRSTPMVYRDLAFASKEVTKLAESVRFFEERYLRNASKEG